MGLALWIAIHRVPWLGPALADSVRAVVGPKPVAWAENIAYGVQDRLNRWRYQDQAPSSYWQVPQGSNTAAPVAASPAASSQTSAPVAAASADRFAPTPFVPPEPSVTAPGDGVWIPMNERFSGSGPSAMVKTTVHPDAERTFSMLAVVAMDLSRIRLHAAAGTHEPVDSTFPAALRTGLIDPTHHDTLIAAFNGGFQTIHGGYGMMVQGHRIGEPQTDACTVAIYPNGTVRIRSWQVLAGETQRMEAYRQTPRCLVEQGQRHPDLKSRYKTSWGAVVNGTTVIRRSALGVSEDGRTLYFGMGDGLTARSLADGMRAAGAFDVAQLDINHAFPRFVLFDKINAKLQATSALCSGFSYSPQDYVTEPKKRDFFFVTRRGG